MLEAQDLKLLLVDDHLRLDLTAEQGGQRVVKVDGRVLDLGLQLLQLHLKLLEKYHFEFYERSLSNDISLYFIFIPT